MAEISTSVRDRQACFGPPPEPDESDLQCKASETSDDSGPPGVANASADLGSSVVDSVPADGQAPNKAVAKGDADYATLSVAATFPFLTTVGVAASHTIDRFGHHYFGVAIGAGVGIATPVSLATSTGKLIHDQAQAPTTEKELRDFLCGDSVGIKGGVGSGVGLTTSAGGTAVETSVATAVEVGVSFGHNWGRGCP